MNWWIRRTGDQHRIGYPYFRYWDPGGTLGIWRTVKLERGLLRHPSFAVRVPACRALLELGSGQDECWESLLESEKVLLHESGSRCCSAEDIAAQRNQLQRAGISMWEVSSDRENRRLLTAVSNRQLRTEFCNLYARAYPGDTDTGCPADQLPPATIVTERGDVPLVGAWPT